MRSRPWGLLLLPAASALILTSCNSTAACEAYKRDQAFGPGMSAAVITPRMSCIAGVTFEGHLYVNMQQVATDIGDEIDGVVQPGCNDTGGTSEPDLPMTAFQFGNYCTTDVLAVGKGDTKYLYVRQP